METLYLSGLRRVILVLIHILIHRICGLGGTAWGVRAQGLGISRMHFPAMASMRASVA